MKRNITLLAVAIAAACASLDASAHTDVGVYLGFPAPVYEAPPPVVYEAPPVVYAPAQPVYGYPYGGYYERRGWHDNGWHKGWHHHHHHDDDDD